MSDDQSAAKPAGYGLDGWYLLRSISEHVNAIASISRHAPTVLDRVDAIESLIEKAERASEPAGQPATANPPDDQRTKTQRLCDERWERKQAKLAAELPDRLDQIAAGLGDDQADDVCDAAAQIRLAAAEPAGISNPPDSLGHDFTLMTQGVGLCRYCLCCEDSCAAKRVCRGKIDDEFASCGCRIRPAAEPAGHPVRNPAAMAWYGVAVSLRGLCSLEPGDSTALTRDEVHASWDRAMHEHPPTTAAEPAGVVNPPDLLNAAWAVCTAWSSADRSERMDKAIARLVVEVDAATAAELTNGEAVHARTVTEAR